MAQTACNHEFKQRNGISTTDGWACKLLDCTVEVAQCNFHDGPDSAPTFMQMMPTHGFGVWIKRHGRSWVKIENGLHLRVQKIAEIISICDTWEDVVMMLNIAE